MSQGRSRSVRVSMPRNGFTSPPKCVVLSGQPPNLLAMSTRKPLHIYLGHASVPEDRQMVEELVRCLAPLVRRGEAVVDGRFGLWSGASDGERSGVSLKSADVILLLISSDYTAAHDEEIQAAIVRHRQRASVTLVVLLRPTPLLHLYPFKELIRLPAEQQSVQAFQPRDTAWQQVVDTVDAILRDKVLETKKTAPRRTTTEQLFDQLLLHPDAIRCDRDAQWGQVTGLWENPQNCVILVPGACGQAHTYFEQRIARFLPGRPPRFIAAADWLHDPFPRSEVEFQEALAVGLDLPTPDRLVDELRRILAYRHLVILHRSVSQRFAEEAESPALLMYYQTWLPQLLSKVQANMAVLCVQPVAWPMVSRWRGELARRLGAAIPEPLSTWLRCGKSGYAAHRWMRHLEKNATTELPIFIFRELDDIPDKQLQDYCSHILRLPEPAQRPFISSVRQYASDLAQDQQRTATTEDLFRALARRLQQREACSINVSPESAHGR